MEAAVVEKEESLEQVANVSSEREINEPQDVPIPVTSSIGVPVESAQIFSPVERTALSLQCPQGEGIGLPVVPEPVPRREDDAVDCSDHEWPVSPHPLTSFNWGKDIGLARLPGSAR